MSPVSAFAAVPMLERELPLRVDSSHLIADPRGYTECQALTIRARRDRALRKRRRKLQCPNLKTNAGPEELGQTLG
jgi:hypothetical protein